MRWFRRERAEPAVTDVEAWRQRFPHVAALGFVARSDSQANRLIERIAADLAQVRADVEAIKARMEDDGR